MGQPRLNSSSQDSAGFKKDIPYLMYNHVHILISLLSHTPNIMVDQEMGKSWLSSSPNALLTNIISVLHGSTSESYSSG